MLVSYKNLEWVEKCPTTIMSCESLKMYAADGNERRVFCMSKDVLFGPENFEQTNQVLRNTTKKTIWSDL